MADGEKRGKRKACTKFKTEEATRYLELIETDESSSYTDSDNDPDYDVTKDLLESQSTVSKYNKSLGSRIAQGGSCSMTFVDVERDKILPAPPSVANDSVNTVTDRPLSASDIVHDILSDLLCSIIPKSKNKNRLSRKRTGQNIDNWQKNKRRNRCSKGLARFDSDGKFRNAKEPIEVDCSKCRYRCSENITETQRNDICASYWGLGDFNRQRDYLLHSIEIHELQRKRPRPGKNSKPRANSAHYFFQVDISKVRVCKNFFCKTLNISHGPIDTAVKNKTDAGSFCGLDKRGKHTPWNKTNENSKNIVRDHIKLFPVMESHYTRKHTQRKYLDKTLNIAKMYQLYKRYCADLDPAIEVVSEKVYRTVFCKEFNLSFFVPKKDQCALCNKFKNLTSDAKQSFQASQDDHIKRHKEAQLAKQQDKERALIDEHFTIATFDLQSVLQLPSCDVSLTYYSRKLCVYNLTILENKCPNEGQCFCWTEIDGGRGSCEIATCLHRWLSSLPNVISEISLFSDTCSGQNRNVNVLAMLLFMVRSKRFNIITQNFLESGHTFMEVDSMHAAIEHEKKHRDCFSLTEWTNIFKNARRSKKPYNVKRMRYPDFIDFKTVANELISNRKKDKNGENMNWLLVKAFQLRADSPDTIFFKYNQTDEYRKLNCSLRRRSNTTEPVLRNLYNKEKPVSKAKKQDLLGLCNKMVIPEEFHYWYESIPSLDAIQDTLPEPDITNSDPETFE